MEPNLRDPFTEWKEKWKHIIAHELKVPEQMFAEYIKITAENDPNFQNAYDFYEKDKDPYMMALTVIEMMKAGIWELNMTIGQIMQHDPKLFNKIKSRVKQRVKETLNAEDGSDTTIPESNEQSHS